MTMKSGSRLGPYEVLSPLGAGGLGEVWRARDTRLDREVAIKVLPAAFAENAQLRLRFEREAKAISSLNHPHICTLHDIGHHEGVDYLVMEMLEGESLADRLGKGPLPLDQVLRYGSQVAHALDAAHRQGIVHRDLKPGNVMLTKSGAKLLDFGLAKSGPAIEFAVEGATVQKALTQEGTILGTFQYMAPEQLEGLEADARTDIFALGCLLYEMATGRRAFEGKSRTSLIAAIVSSQPAPISSIAPMTPPGFEHVVRKCLEKHPDHRWQSAEDVASELQWISEAGSQAGVATPLMIRRKTREKLAWTLAAAFALMTVAAAIEITRRAGIDSDARPIRSSLVAADGRPYPYSGESVGAVLSPDGQKIVFVAKNDAGRDILFVRPLNGTQAQPLTGTEDASFPFWSPDSHYIGFFSGAKLKKIEAAGGPAIAIAPAGTARGGTWSREGVIVFAPDSQGGLYRISASGGTVKQLTAPDLGRNETSHRWPSFLPDGKHFVFLVAGQAIGDEGNAIHAGSLDPEDKPKRIVKATTQALFRDGHLLFVRDGFLLAQRFDPKSMELAGDAVPLAEQVRQSVEVWGKTHFSASDNGLLLYDGGASAEINLVVVDPSGKEIGTIGEPAIHRRIRLSPDEKRIASSIIDPATGTSDIWILESHRDVKARLTFEAGNDSSPIWSPDGTRIAFASERSGEVRLVEKSAVGGASEKVLLSSRFAKTPEDWSRDGRFIAFDQVSTQKNDIWILPLAGDQKPFPLVAGPHDEGWSTFSPDTRWIAYLSNESGRFEAYAMRFPPVEGSGKWQLSSKGANWLVGWRQDGRELYYLDLSGHMQAVTIDTSRDMEAGTPRTLFATDSNLSWASARDGKTFVIGKEPAGRQNIPTTLVINWPAMLKE